MNVSQNHLNAFLIDLYLGRLQQNNSNSLNVCLFTMFACIKNVSYDHFPIKKDASLLPTLTSIDHIVSIFYNPLYT